MRLLANYSYKDQVSSYMVSMETMGDVPREQAGSVVDDLFRMAKEAIQRQIHPEITLDDPMKTGNGKNGNGNGKPVIKDPSLPITAKQKQTIIRLARERGDFIDGLDVMTMGEASKIIGDLLLVEV